MTKEKKLTKDQIIENLEKKNKLLNLLVDVQKRQMEDLVDTCVKHLEEGIELVQDAYKSHRTIMIATLCMFAVGTFLLVLTAI